MIFFLCLVKIKKDPLRGNAKGNGDYPYHLKFHSNVADIYFASRRNISKFSLGEEKCFQSDTWWNAPLSFELVSFIPFRVSCSLYQPLPLSPSCFPLGCIPHSLRLSTQLGSKYFESACNSQGYVSNFQIKSFLGIFCPCAKAELTG